ncbi:arginine--tRNA ligase [Candidatus Curtissbacteria bacterium RIFCSPLOWO2_12_FULL_38_9]|uniref:Arginine--tRNA ligase n=1 Tax=Candidatus Curtissbacteria bacterium RIFCSPLOWO2_12_FULL_38_9 TaxID=1797735 RepID=A0A1F5IBS1_9BACT|nr:MAG: arginine--tRNA ligase [Candidatus Curtissbacteria bacterium RIFCSPLOWO2_12_FULL_38_9]
MTRPADARYGDYSTNVALKIATRDTVHETRNKRSPMEIARELADSLQSQAYIEKLEVSEPGFVNFFIKDVVWQNQVSDVLEAELKFGSNDSGRGKKARVEFVSANPTGPLHFGNARGGPIGDSLASVLEFCGYKVLREYLNNDRGNQVVDLGRTIAVHLGLIEKGEGDLAYLGEYVKELSANVKSKIGNTKDLSQDEVAKKVGELAVRIMFEEIIKDTRDLGIKYDLITTESDLQKEAPKVLTEFERRGLLKKLEGAVWFGDRGAVVVKSDGTFTYFTADLVYHKQKFESGYDLVVDVFGSNTSGHVPKLRELADVLGFNQEKLKVILYQFVRIKRGSDIVKMSKRSGTFVTVREVLDEVGRDALRFFILMHEVNTHIDFDLDLAKEKSSKNPVYYVQYANARICSILAKAKGKKPFDKTQGKLQAKSNHELLTGNYELNLVKQISRFPELVEDISENFAVNQLTTYAMELADSFHKFYENCPVLLEKEELRQARLALISATQIALANTLRLLGVSAPEKM